MPTVIANEIVGVQPMTGPYAQIHTMRVVHGDAVTGVMRWCGSLLAVQHRQVLLQQRTTTTPLLLPRRLRLAPVALRLRLLNSFAGATGTMEGYAGRRVAIQTLRQIVEARTRKLSARWTFESAQDAQAQQGIDIEEELMAALAQEITAEIDQEILYHLTALLLPPTVLARRPSTRPTSRAPRPSSVTCTLLWPFRSTALPTSSLRARVVVLVTGQSSRRPR
jgi:hypothetical protein